MLEIRGSLHCFFTFEQVIQLACRQPCEGGFPGRGRSLQHRLAARGGVQCGDPDERANLLHLYQVALLRHPG